MLQHKISSRSTVVLSVALFSLPVAADGGPPHGEDVVVGRTSSGQLAVEVPVPGPHELPPVAGFLNGWAAADPGLLNLESDEAKEGFFTLGAGAIINLELVAIDPALRVWSPGFSSVLTSPGQSFIIGGSVFDTHPTFHIDSDDPAFDAETQVYSVTLRLFDTGTTGYGSSEPFTLSFTPVPEPGATLLLGFGAVVLWTHRPPWRRERRLA